MARVDSITFESGTTKQNFALSGARLVSMCPTQAQFICHRYHDVKVSRYMYLVLIFYNSPLLRLFLV